MYAMLLWSLKAAMGIFYLRLTVRTYHPLSLLVAMLSLSHKV